MSDPDPIELAMRVVQGSGTASEGASSPDAVTGEKPNLPPPLPIAPKSSGLTPAARTKGRKTANELAAMILDDLRQIEGCPKRGVRVTVYGSESMEFVAVVWRRRRPGTQQTRSAGFSRHHHRTT